MLLIAWNWWLDGPLLSFHGVAGVPLNYSLTDNWLEVISVLHGSLLNYCYLEGITGMSGFLLFCNTAYLFVVDTLCISEQVLHPAKGRDGLVLWETHLLIYAVQQVLLPMARDAIDCSVSLRRSFLVGQSLSVLLQWCMLSCVQLNTLILFTYYTVSD